MEIKPTALDMALALPLPLEHYAGRWRVFRDLLHHAKIVRAVIVSPEAQQRLTGYDTLVGAVLPYRNSGAPRSRK